MQHKNKLIETIPVRVRFDEVDALGIVWHGHYVKYLEDAREAFGRKYELTYMGVYGQGFSVPLVSLKMDYKLPLKYEDIALAEVEFVNSEAAKLIFKYKIYNPQGQVVMTAETVQIFLTKEGDLQLTIPAFFAEWKKKYLI